MVTATVRGFSEVKLIDNEGEVTELTYSLPPREALVAAVNHYVFNNYNSLSFREPVGIIETPVAFTYQYGENSAIWVRK